MPPVKPQQDPNKQIDESLQVVKVEGKSALNDFIHLPWSLYTDDPMWVPPLVLERRMQLSPNNPYFDHAKYCSWIANRNGNPVGRISTQIDRLYLDRYQNATGFFGMLESEDNARTFQLLLETAEAWLRNRGMQRIAGPFNLSINQELGLLVDGFDTPPSVMMGHARPYYARRIEENGYRKEKDLLAYIIDSNVASKKIRKIATRAKNRVHTRPLQKSNF
ncbi:MAG: N-acetyltransferase, partial [Planctomycetota bacterium]